jgi:hypothetical protein
VLDIAANLIKIFPTEVLPLNLKLTLNYDAQWVIPGLLQKITKLTLKEFYFENNSLMEKAPVHSTQEQEVLSLKVKRS